MELIEGIILLIIGYSFGVLAGMSYMIARLHKNGYYWNQLTKKG